jgi:hypothetical protein
MSSRPAWLAWLAGLAGWPGWLQLAWLAWLDLTWFDLVFCGDVDFT